MANQDEFNFEEADRKLSENKGPDQSIISGLCERQTPASAFKYNFFFLSSLKLNFFRQHFLLKAFAKHH